MEEVWRRCGGGVEEVWRCGGVEDGEEDGKEEGEEKGGKAAAAWPSPPLRQQPAERACRLRARLPAPVGCTGLVRGCKGARGL